MSSARQIARHAAASAFYASGGFRRITERRAKQKQVCVLGLHRILTEDDIEHSHSEAAIILKRSTFAELCAFLAQHFEVVSLASVLDGKGTPSSRKPRCVLTFDDGWQDNYSHALPILKQFAFPATIFLATAMMDSTSTFWVERVRGFASESGNWRELRERISGRIGKAAEKVELRDVTEYLKHRSSEQRDKIIAEVIGELPQAGASDRMLTWEQVSEMAAAGVAFAGHTHTHPLLPYEPAEKASSELCLSKEKLREHGSDAACGFAYPNGSWNETVRKQVLDAGYSCAATTQPGWFTPGEDVYSMRRILLHEGNVTGPDGRFSPHAAGLTLMGWR
jgi:peptidoglycan/xylan/chitin deacetylase (PgdA/CDA1 family)